MKNEGLRRQVLWTAVCVLVTVAALAWVDLSPRVDGDFFFSPDDPQLQTTEQIAKAFPAPQQILVRAAGDIDSDAYRDNVRALTQELEALPGVNGVNSVATERARNSPLWSRVLLPPDGEATNLVVITDGTDAEVLVPVLEAALAGSQGAGFSLQMSGVPVIVELIRRSLFRDLVVFSTAALVVFGLLIGLVYREVRVVVGTLTASGLACSLTLVLNQAVGLSIGLLTANIVTIVFVLTLSHIVFLTANARRVGAALAVRATLPASFWAMVTTLLGFLSLTLASARPLRELGLAGAIGAAVAIVVAYTVYPAFLSGEPVTPQSLAVPPPAENDSAGGSSKTVIGVAAFAVVVLLIGSGVPRVDTDPGLLTYFAPGSELREGLESIDRDGGSSTLEIVVRDVDGARLDSDAGNNKMWAFQDSLEAMSAVGVVLSPPVLFGHARLQPLAGFVPLNLLADILESDALDNVGLAFLSSDRQQARFYARMHELDRNEPRRAVIARIEAAALGAGLEPALVGGVYDLQRELGELIASSLRVGLGGLLALFLLIGLVVTRSWRIALMMLSCLVGIPLVVLGAFGHLRVPIDMITSPAANVALAMGVDSMIHLVIRARALGGWEEARRQMKQPILAGSLIICLGFGIFAFSSFPPTARFGVAVILGTLTAATMALFVLPTLGGLVDQRAGRTAS